MISIPCVIFAGGKSSRMGEDKALLPFGSFSTLTEYQLARLSKIFSNVYISCKDKNKFNFDANFIEDVPSQNTYAPTLGFVSAFKYLKTESFFAISVDSPFIDEAIMQTLVDSDENENDATVAKTDRGTQPLCGIYHNSLEEKFQEMQKTDNHKLGFLLKNSRTSYVYFKDEEPFLNLNNPQEYEIALKRINT